MYAIVLWDSRMHTPLVSELGDLGTCSLDGSHTGWDATCASRQAPSWEILVTRIHCWSDMKEEGRESAHLLLGL